MFIIITVLDLLHTTICSGFLGHSCTEWIDTSDAPDNTCGVCVLASSAVFVFQILTVPSLDAVITCLPSLEKIALERKLIVT